MADNCVAFAKKVIYAFRDRVAIYPYVSVYKCVTRIKYFVIIITVRDIVVTITFFFNRSFG